MIIDAHKIEADTKIDCDLCIVGAGAAGITLAHELRDQGIQVVLLESGGAKFEADTQDLYKGEALDPNHGDLDTQRQRALGGTTNVWGGRCAPFDEIDFEARPHVPYSGWPIRRQDLDPYYARAHVYCELGSYRYSVDEALAYPSPTVPHFHSQDVLTDKLWLFSPPTNFKKTHTDPLKKSDSVKIFLHANCLQAVTDADGNRVEHLEVSSLRKNRFSVHARHFVFAMGCLEVTRLLLASNRTHRRGIGNEADLVGRFYMGHLTCEIAEVAFNLPADAVAWNYEKTIDSVYCRRTFAISEQKQRQDRLLNFRAIFTYPQMANPDHGNGILSAAYLTKSLMLNNQVSRLYYSKGLPANSAFQDLPGHLKNIAVDSGEVARFSAEWLNRRIFSKRKLPSVVLKSKSNKYTFHCDAEQSPNPDSRVMLGEAKDCFGLNRLKVDWRYTDSDVTSITRSLQVIGRTLERAKVGTVRATPEAIEECVRQTSGVGSHHIGTTRMADGPKSGVVDRNCKVHGIDNLYIASSSVFPTSSFANPTLTIVAIALRLADRLKRIYR